MLTLLKDLYMLLTSEQRKRLILLQFLVVLMAFAEIASVIAIGPFMAIVGDGEILDRAGWVSDLYNYTGVGDRQEFLLVMGIGVLFFLLFASLLSMYTVWKLALYGTRVGAEISSRLFQYYLHQSWNFHIANSSSQLSNKIAQESFRITDNVINPLMYMNAKLILVFCMSCALVLYDPLVAFSGIFIFSVVYVFLYFTVRRRLIRNGESISESQLERFKLMSEGFGGIKDLLLLERQKIFGQRFLEASERLAYAQGTTLVVGQLPRYAMELVAFGSIVTLVIYLLYMHDGDLGTLLPVLSVYALAGFKLLPALQAVYSSISLIRGNLSAIEVLNDDLYNSADWKVISPQEQAGVLTFNDEIKLEEVSFTYPGKKEPAVKNISLEIGVNQMVGLVGPSGGGKSTLVDILLGLLSPELGRLLIDGVLLNDENIHLWHRMIGFVPQSIYLMDGTIKDNIAFGLPRDEVDDDRIHRAVELAHLGGFVRSLPHGLDTRVGERGVQLSGGQIQRIGIARALYYDPAVLILDEATSALDGVTEKAIMQAINDFSGKKTIIMIAHRLATVKKCDCIYLLNSGEIVNKGSFSELLSISDEFKKLSESS